VSLPPKFKTAGLSDFDQLPGPVSAFLARLHSDDCIETRLVESRFYLEPPSEVTLIKPSPAAEPGLILTGPVGVGKTHLAAAIHNHVHEYAEQRHAGVAALFVDVPDLVHITKNAVGSKRPRPEELCSAYDVQLLVMDDLAGIRPTEFAVDTVGGIIRHRYNWQLVTIFTANATPRDLAKLLGQGIVSRLREMAELVELTGDDLRGSRRHAA
jgi:DNA replication protein DnaC